MSTAAAIGIVLAMTQIGHAESAEIKVVAGGFLLPVMNELGPRFERTTGDKLLMKWVPGPAVGREVESGQPVDVAIAQAETIDGLIRAGKVDANTRAELLRIGLGVVVRTGAPKPDITSVEGFKRALLDAKSVATSPGSVSGVHLVRLLEQWGIADAVRPKIKSPPVGTGGAFEAVARGEAEIGFAAYAIVPGTELIGPLPSELQIYQVFVAGIATATREKEAARTLLELLTSESAAAVIRAKGMEPVAR